MLPPGPNPGADIAKLPVLEIIDFSQHKKFTKPVKKIHEGNDVNRFLTSLAYRDIGIFMMQLNRAMCPRNQPNTAIPKTFPLTSNSSDTSSINSLQALLGRIEDLVTEAPPDPGPRRFGNVSFRKWHSLLEERIGGLVLEGKLAQVLSGDAKEEAVSYLLGGFGSSQRLDYGTGHELSFVAFLGCLWKLGYFSDGEQGGKIEREIILQVIERYLAVVRKLILTYTLEPAGSHGVWGLDDHAFIPYIFGSAQFTRPINENEPMPLEGSVRGAPKPSSITSADIVADYRQTNMYFSAVGFINDVKKGPFWEHSPILFDISGIRDGWGKINKGMIKMFNAEVLSKFPVVQHFPFGSLFSWDEDPEAVAPIQSVHMVNQPPTLPGPPGTASGAGPGTAAPWVQGGQMPSVTGNAGMPYTRAPPPPPPGAGVGTAAPWARGAQVHSAMGSAGPRTGTLGRPAPVGAASIGSTEPQITVTKAPWAK